MQEFNTELERRLEKHYAMRAKLYGNSTKKEVYANAMTDADARYQQIVKNIREPFLKEYRERWDKKWANKSEEGQQ